MNAISPIPSSICLRSRGDTNKGLITSTGECGTDSSDIRGKICHLVFELREGADVMDAVLLAERRHRFGPHHLAARGADRGKRHVWVDHAERRPNHVAAVVDLGDDAVGAV